MAQPASQTELHRSAEDFIRLLARPANAGLKLLPSEACEHNAKALSGTLVSARSATRHRGTPIDQALQVLKRGVARAPYAPALRQVRVVREDQAR